MSFSFRKLLPRSLRARLVLLVLGCVLLAQASTLVIGAHYRDRYLEDVALDYIATTIRTLRAALSEIPAEDRSDFVRDASQGQWHLWARTLPAEAQIQRFNWGGLPPPPPSPPPMANPQNMPNANGLPGTGSGNGPGRGGPGGPSDSTNLGRPGSPGATTGSGRNGGPVDTNGPGRSGGPGDANGPGRSGSLGGPGGPNGPSGSQGSRPGADERGGGRDRFYDRRGGPEDDTRKDLRELVRQLNRRLNDGTRVALSRGPTPEVFISLANNPSSEDAPRLREWLVIPVDRLDPPAPTPLIVAWLGGLGVVLLLAAGFSWTITRPITRLAHAADQLAAGQPQRVTPSGPHETRVLGERFNAMLDALAESESVRRTLLAGLPHDLKGPLSRMWLRIEMADDPVLKDGLRKDLQDMQHMVDQFIGFVRGTDPAGYRYAPIPFAEWVVERVHNWEGAGSPVHLTMAPDTVMTLQGDAVALARLLDNLISNALHHGAPPVEVTLAARAGQAILTVADHGPGIPAERRAEALRPFARLDDARTRSGNVGLGLALADAITRAHGGTLTLGAAPWGGLSVEIALPLQAG
ncbi:MULTISPECIES: HAMP domain-containing sensor histidine kinase [unclassified Achromobacter]|uniref:sensor histidine kinase n=1 Tax=unclassified Achromobacter TaxID=2626865 RepID=UPI001E482C41|nr:MULTISPECIES: HAMP domain-containing sensor histidine kinase [unclassified Achromobacter]